jgi:ketosteroid isomerase-like protein
MNLQEISDRLEINELVVRYAYAIDSRDWDALDAIFTPDAHIDFTATGGEAGELPAIKTFLEGALPFFSGTQHLMAGTILTFDGDDAAHGTTMCHNPMVYDSDGHEHVMLIGLWYDDTFVRTADGWRITNRSQRQLYSRRLKTS